MMNRFLYITSIVLLSTICACQKKEQENIAKPTARIEIESPQQQQKVLAGMSLPIQAHIKGEVTLHGYEVFIVDKYSFDTLYYVDNHTHATDIQVSEIWTDTLTRVADLIVYIRTEINHQGSTVSDSVTIKSVL